MTAGYVLPLYPLYGFVLLPTQKVEVTPTGPVASELIRRAARYDGQLVASFFEDEAVHEVGVRARVFPMEGEQEAAIFEGVSRCRLLELVAEDVPMVRAEDFPDHLRPRERQEAVRRLLLRRFGRLFWEREREFCRKLAGLTLDRLTWQITPSLNLELEQQQGLLNLADPVARGQVLLLAIKELERREKFLRPFAWLRKGGQWN
ncbi:MAG: LON peptidase substrate-binding domain-containing protein [Thermoanaerobaculum sp.]